MRRRITQRLAETAKAEGKPYRITDDLTPGLTLRVEPSGRKVWTLRAGGTDRKLGVFPQMTAGMARDAALKRLRGEVEDKPAAPTLARFLRDTYEPWLAVHRKGAEKETYRLRAFPWQSTRLDEITVAAVERWRTVRLSEGRAPKTVDRDLAPLRAALNRAVKWDIIETNPLERLEPLQAPSNAVVRYLAVDEEQRLYTALQRSEPWLRTLVPVLLNTGLRRGEALALRWGDVDLAQRRLTVRASTAKTGTARHIPLNQTAYQALTAQRGDAEPLPGVLVWGQREFRRSWASLLRRAKVENFRVHDCRHHFASRLVQAGVGLNEVRELLGHSDLRMTLRYAHLAPENLADAVNRIQKV
jgi:integrase